MTQLDIKYLLMCLQEHPHLTMYTYTELERKYLQIIELAYENVV